MTFSWLDWFSEVWLFGPPMEIIYWLHVSGEWIHQEGMVLFLEYLFMAQLQSRGSWVRGGRNWQNHGVQPLCELPSTMTAWLLEMEQTFVIWLFPSDSETFSGKMLRHKWIEFYVCRKSPVEMLESLKFAYAFSQTEIKAKTNHLLQNIYCFSFY